MKKLTPERRQAVETELALWRTANQQAQKVPLYSNEWFALVRDRNRSFDLIMNCLALSMKRTDLLCWGQATLETFYTPDGEPRKDIATL